MTDWNTIRGEYIASRISIRTLAGRYGIPEPTVQRRAAVEQWTTLRKQFQERLVAETIRKTAKTAAGKEANHLLRLIKATTRAIDVAMEAFEDEQQFQRYIVTESLEGGGTQVQEKVFRKIDTRALKELTSVLKNLTSLQREFYDLPTPEQERGQRLAEERLELERRRADASEGERDTETGVVLLPEVAGEAPEAADEE